MCGVARANLRELDDLLSMDLPIVESMIAAGAPVAGAAAAARRVRRVAEALLEDLQHAGIGDVMPRSRGGTAARPRGDGSDATAPWREAGARAGLARLQVDSGRWREAASHYRALAGGPSFLKHTWPQAGDRRAARGGATADATAPLRVRRAPGTSWLTMLGEQSDVAQHAAVHRDIGDALWLAETHPRLWRNSSRA